MGRAPFVLGATVAGTAALVAFRPHAAATTPPAVATTTASASSSRVSSQSSSASSSSSASGSGSKAYLGAVEPNQYGNVQVKITVSGGKITDVEAVQLPQNDPRSSEISSSVAPTLREEALQAQSAQIDFVSGATYTSTGYQASLASAVGQAGI